MIILLDDAISETRSGPKSPQYSSSTIPSSRSTTIRPAPLRPRSSMKRSTMGDTAEKSYSAAGADVDVGRAVALVASAAGTVDGSVTSVDPAGNVAASSVVTAVAGPDEPGAAPSSSLQATAASTKAPSTRPLAAPRRAWSVDLTAVPSHNVPCRSEPTAALTPASQQFSRTLCLRPPCGSSAAKCCTPGRPSRVSSPVPHVSSMSQGRRYRTRRRLLIPVLRGHPVEPVRCAAVERGGTGRRRSGTLRPPAYGERRAVLRCPGTATFGTRIDGVSRI